MSKDMPIGSRMKTYYERKHFLTRKVPVIGRIDGKAFHTFSRGYKKPFSEDMLSFMIAGSIELLKTAQGSKCAYIQSDEVSILLTDYDDIKTEAWFNYEIKKLCSVSASAMTLGFIRQMLKLESIESINKKFPIFDARFDNFPKEEVINYFIWRQRDWERNSISLLARSVFSNRELHRKNKSSMHEMLYSKGINWATMEDRWKNGVFISKMDGRWVVHDECPRFKYDKSDILNKWL